MDYLQAELLYKLYREEGKSVDEKLKEMERVFTALEGQDNYVYQEDLKTLFSGELPVIEGVKVSTEMNGQVHSYIAITKMPVIRRQLPCTVKKWTAQRMKVIQ